MEILEEVPLIPPLKHELTAVGFVINRMLNSYRLVCGWPLDEDVNWFLDHCGWNR